MKITANFYVSACLPGNGGPGGVSAVRFEPGRGVSFVSFSFRWLSPARIPAQPSGAIYVAGPLTVARIGFNAAAFPTPRPWGRPQTLGGVTP